jgi:coenzyme F420-dependent glucose-6-phosphate dehydrogenase
MLKLPKKTIGYYCIPDMRDAPTLIRQAKLAVKAGFRAIWVADHFHPWFHDEARESHAWIWMAAAMGEVRDVPFGTFVTAPIFRYHPAIVAQAFATMQSIYGDRVLLGLGSGEAMNELPLGYRWPSVKERKERMVEAIEIIRKLWQEEFVSYKGKYYTLTDANLYMKADLPIFLAAFGPKMGRIAGSLGDGLITSVRPFKYFNEVLFPAVSDGAKAAGKTLNDITKVLEIDISWASDYESAISTTRRWKAGLLPNLFEDPIADPRTIEKLGLENVSDRALEEIYVISANPEDHIRKIEEAFDTGFDHVCLFSSSPDEEKTIEMYSKKILPYFTSG